MSAWEVQVVNMKGHRVVMIFLVVGTGRKVVAEEEVTGACL